MLNSLVQAFNLVKQVSFLYWSWGIQGHREPDSFKRLQGWKNGHTHNSYKISQYKSRFLFLMYNQLVFPYKTSSSIHQIPTNIEENTTLKLRKKQDDLSLV